MTSTKADKEAVRKIARLMAQIKLLQGSSTPSQFAECNS